MGFKHISHQDMHYLTVTLRLYRISYKPNTSVPFLLCCSSRGLGGFAVNYRHILTYTVIYQDAVIRVHTLI